MESSSQPQRDRSSTIQAIVNIVHRWEQFCNQVSLCDVPRHYAGIRQSPFMLQYLTTILRLSPRGCRTLETGVGAGYGAIWLSLRGIDAEGIDNAPRIVERAKLVNNILGGSAEFRVEDLFELAPERRIAPRGKGKPGGRQRADSGTINPQPSTINPPYHVIHHQGVLEHFSVPWIHAALARQVTSAEYVVFSVPSVYYPFEPEFGDERLLPLAEWERILEPSSVEELRYYGDPQFGERENVLAVLKGQSATKRLKAMMSLPDEPYPDGISAVVHTRNEARHIAACLETLQGWTDEIVVCDMEAMTARSTSPANSPITSSSTRSFPTSTAPATSRRCGRSIAGSSTSTPTSASHPASAPPSAT